MCVTMKQHHLINSLQFHYGLHLNYIMAQISTHSRLQWITARKISPPIFWIKHSCSISQMSASGKELPQMDIIWASEFHCENKSCSLSSQYRNRPAKVLLWCTSLKYDAHFGIAVCCGQSAWLLKTREGARNTVPHPKFKTTPAQTWSRRP